MDDQQQYSLRLSSGQTAQLSPGVALRIYDIPGLQPAAGDMVAEIASNPADPAVLGLKNLSKGIWSARLSSGEVRQIDPGRSLRLASGTRINFGQVHGEIGLTNADRTPKKAPIATNKWPLVASAVVVLLVIVIIGKYLSSSGSTPATSTVSGGTQPPQVRREPQPPAGEARDYRPPAIDWNKSFDNPQYLLHIVPSAGGAAAYYFLYPSAPDANGKVTTPTAGGGAITETTDVSKGPFKTPGEVCRAAKGLGVKSLSPWNSWDSFNCMDMG